MGRRRLRYRLTVPPDPIPVIQQRQAAIRELAKSLKWRQWFLAYGIAAKDQMRDPDFLFKWVKDQNLFFLKRSVILSIRVLTSFTIGIIIAHFITQSIPLYIPVIMLILQFGLLKVGIKRRTIILATAGEYERNLQLYADLLQHILKKDYQSAYLQRLRHQLFNQGKK